MDTRHRLVLGILAGVFALAGEARATPVLDVAIEPDAPSVGTWLHGPAPGISGVAQDSAQSFTVGVTGDLVSLELQIGLEWSGVVEPLLVDVRPVDAQGVPLADDASALASVSVAAADLVRAPGIPRSWFAIALPTPVAVVAGQTLAAVLRSDDPARDAREPGFEFGYLWAGQEEIYPGGEGFFRLRSDFNDTWGTGFPEDFSLRTFVTGVPEPARLVLAAPLALGFLRRRPGGPRRGLSPTPDRRGSAPRAPGPPARSV